MNSLLILIPTYNELNNVGPICDKLVALSLQADIHFIDDHSPDGTGQELDRLSALHPTISVTHRTGKLGIGSAHKDGIAYAYAKGYRQLITMDCDFTHDPGMIPKLLAFGGDYDVVLGSRHMESKSLNGWSVPRKFLTTLAHFLTKTLLGIQCDATGAYRLYNLSTIPSQLFTSVRSMNYSFFFESIFVITANGYTIKEIPITLPPRTQGVSKMSYLEPFRGLGFLLSLFLQNQVNPARFRVYKKA